MNKVAAVEGMHSTTSPGTQVQGKTFKKQGKPTPLSIRPKNGRLLVGDKIVPDLVRKISKQRVLNDTGAFESKATLTDFNDVKPIKKGTT